MARLPDEPRNVIYGLSCKCHPERGIRYVGQTRRGVDARFAGHRKAARYGRRLPVYSWMRKHGMENIFPTVLDVADTFDELARLEVDWISTVKERGGADLNMTSGGFGPDGYTFTSEQLARLSRAKTGVSIHTEEHKRWMSDRYTGEGNPAAKLTRAQVGRIRSLYAEGAWPRWICEHEGVSDTVMLYIVNNKYWHDAEWVKPAGDTLKRLRNSHWTRAELGIVGGPSLTEQDKKDIRQMYAAGGVTQAEIAAHFSIDQSSISRAITGARIKR